MVTGLKLRFHNMTDLKAFGMWFGNSLLSGFTFFIESWLPGICLAITTVLAGIHYYKSWQLKDVERKIALRELEEKEALDNKADDSERLLDN